jgi:hypothetical protein
VSECNVVTPVVLKHVAQYGLLRRIWHGLALLFAVRLRMP